MDVLILEPLTIAACVLIALGVAGCAMGERQLRNYVGLIGFILGGIVGASLGTQAYGAAGMLPGAVFGALVGAAVRVLGPTGSLFVAGALAGAVVAVLLSAASYAWRHPLLILLPLVGGLAAVQGREYGAMAATSLKGAAAMSWGAALVLGGPSHMWDGAFVRAHAVGLLILVGILFIAGIAWQSYLRHQDQTALTRYLTE